MTPRISTATAATPTPKAAAKPSKEDDRYHEFLVLLDDQASTKVNKAFDMPMGIKRREYVVKTLLDNVMKTQQPLWDVLDGLQAAGHVAEEGGYTPLWIQNGIIVKGDETAETVMSSAAGVAQAMKSAKYTITKPPSEIAEIMDADLDAGGRGTVDKGKDPQWNVARMGVQKAWKDGLTGKGVTVAGIDTGVDATHPALLTNYRGYDADSGDTSNVGNWFDATGESEEPADDGGHGTHTMGTIVGTDGRSNKIGMAPDAQWFAARGLGEHGGTDGMLLRSFQYTVAPKVPTPGVSPGAKRVVALGADVINNSWGSTDGMSVAYLNALRNMAAMGVINVVAAGNDGQGGKAGSIGSPASNPYVIPVAATDRKDKVAEFSSRGPNPLPTTDGEPVPFVGAPGVDIRSAIPGGTYERGWQGTSMATPAIAGLVTLAQQAAVEETGKMFDVATMKDVLRRAAQDVGPKGPDTGTGYGIPVADNLREIVKQVATDRGLLAPKAPEAEKPAPKLATRRQRVSKPDSKG